jgi:hypothetical protein
MESAISKTLAAFSVYHLEEKGQLSDNSWILVFRDDDIEEIVLRVNGTTVSLYDSIAIEQPIVEGFVDTFKKHLLGVL